ncbi:MAG: hypothetical protein JWN86_4703 [Planctomycetota bacterium]|nr:hypothetical protein [Planctomycetota bacterium]
MLAGLGPSVAYAIETDDGLVLVDSGLEPDAGLLLTALGKLGLGNKPILAVLLTHAHGDHCGGAARLRAMSVARIYAGRGDAQVIRDGGSRDAIFSTFEMTGHAPHPTPIDVELVGGETLKFGGVRVRALATPGHTPGSVCYLLEKGGRRILFSGDVISSLVGEPSPHAPGREPLGTYSAYLSTQYRGDAATYRDSLRALRALPAPDLVLPGHPGSDPTPQFPVLAHGRWEAMLDKGIAEMEALVSHRAADSADFLDGHAKELLPGLDYLGDFRGRAVFSLLASSRLAIVSSPSGPGLLEFVAATRKGLGRAPVVPSAILLTSSRPGEIAGLGDFALQSDSAVVGPSSAEAAIRTACGPKVKFVVSDQLAQLGWLPAEAIPLRGRGVAPCAYQIVWAGKSVLFTGNIPIIYDGPALADLTADLTRDRDAAIEYLLSIASLEKLKPDLWLPAIPSNGQNANLYGREWTELIENNYRFGATGLAP